MRDQWLSILLQIINPVINSFVNKNIKFIFPIHHSAHLIENDKRRNQTEIVFIELFSRTLLGVSILFQNEESINKDNLNDLFQNVLFMINTTFSGYLDFYHSSIDHQLIVEMANCALAFIRAPYLWNSLHYLIKNNILKIMYHSITKFKTHMNNWLLFEAIIEIFLYKNQKIKILNKTLFNLQIIESYYIGDGWYKDGPLFHMDFYNSYVILPFLITIYQELHLLNYKNNGILYKNLYNKTLLKIQRQSEFLERLISQDGSFPIFGRSGVYRTAIFHALVTTTYISGLPNSLSYGQVRTGLNAVIENMFQNEKIKIVDEHGFLTFGFSGFQPEMADEYSNSGSIYFALLIFMPLGLNENHIFWNSSSEDWSQKKMYNGNSINKDKSIN
jgi:hypothetical protein